MKRFVCIHGHFYQPPRENPWLEVIEPQESSRPYCDWNERITAECYAPNASARILDGKGQLLKSLNNYAKISFNFGPTLLSWLEQNSPEVYRAILQADQESAERFSGHGSAMAQPYHHMIMPLALRRDRVTQVKWGVRDFEHRFKRKPGGMWLPETAVDLETLEVLAEAGIRFTILSPHQASSPVDPTRPYEQRLPSGKRMAIFFYNGSISKAIAFERLLESGPHFFKTLLRAFPDRKEKTDALVSVATDGETYGHHHKFGEMALAWVLDRIESSRAVQLTHYAEYLSQHTPEENVQILENSSWSCAHGVERWRSNCGCCTGANPTWNQAWRSPLRQALDWLRDRALGLFEEGSGRLLKDPWAARDDYIEVILDPSLAGMERFLARHASGELPMQDKVSALKWLELTRYAMGMYASCGWFFDDLAGVETIQIIRYAGQVVELSRDLAGEDLEAGFLQHLEKAQSNLASYGDGRRIWKRFVSPWLEKRLAPRWISVLK